MPKKRTDQERYEAINIIIKARADGKPWFDVIFDMITEDCEGDEEKPCTCGLESAGGSTGTLKQCYEWLWPDEEWEDE